MALYNLNEMPPRVREGFRSHLISAATIRMLRAEVAAGTSTTHHNHPDEEIVFVLDGRIKVFSGGNEVELGAGELVVFPAYVDHHYEAVVDSVTIEVFGPGRTDFRSPAGDGRVMLLLPLVVHDLYVEKRVHEVTLYGGIGFVVIILGAHGRPALRIGDDRGADVSMRNLGK